MSELSGRSGPVPGRDPERAMSERDAMSLGTPADRWPAHREERALAPDRRHPVIVVGLDGSATSWDAFAWAVGEATRSNGTLTAVYATPLVNRVAAFGMPFDYAAAEQAWQDAAAELRDEAEQRVRGLGLRLEFVREQGDPAQALTRVAGCAQADLIVVGTSAKMRHHVTRSLGRRLLSKRGAPVIAVVP